MATSSWRGEVSWVRTLGDSEEGIKSGKKTHNNDALLIISHVNAVKSTFTPAAGDCSWNDKFNV